jgi:hypothetical protein
VDALTIKKFGMPKGGKGLVLCRGIWYGNLRFRPKWLSEVSVPNPSSKKTKLSSKEFFRTCNVLPFSCTHLALWRGNEEGLKLWLTI